MDEISKKKFIQEHKFERGMALIPGIENIIAVSSGKGGVGKSTVAVNLALALSKMGKRVGILDADIYGPSVPKMLKLDGAHPTSSDGMRLDPLESYGLQVMSMGLMVDETTSMSWRGPMVTMVLKQLLTETNWKDIDFLVVDMPPGTGDIPITMAKQMPLTGVVLVTTPQDIALIDVLKGMKMYENMGVPIYGVVENMSVHVCTDCGKVEHIFGQGASKRLKEEHGVELLSSLPLHISICEQTDKGNPTMVAEPDGVHAQMYTLIAEQVVDKTPEKVLSPFYQDMLDRMCAGVEDQGCQDMSSDVS